MGWWEDRVVPRLVDTAGSSAEVMNRRREVCRGLRGRVLEIGFGSGLNTGSYPAEVTSVAAVEPSDLGWKLSEARRLPSSVPITRTGLDGQSLTEEDASCDSALSTLTLCTIPDAAKALAEVRRVLRPGGVLHFLEHGLAPNQGVVRWQHRLEPLQRRAFAGCHLTRHLPMMLAESGFEVVDLEEGYLPGPPPSRPWSYCYQGRAVRTA
jgi:ubiquinone/menaquinone biosynthesis C-methylase UbiE